MSGQLGTGPSLDPDYDIDVRIWPFDETVAARCRAAVPDVKIRVLPREGVWRRM